MRTTTSSSTSHLGPSVRVEAGTDDAVELALQAARGAVRPKSRTVWPWVLVSQALVLVVGYIATPYFTTHLTFDKQAMEAQEAEVRERAKAYVAEEEAQRAKYEIQEEHREPLKKQERAKRRNEVVAHVYELEEIAQRIREKRDEQLDRLTEIPPERPPDSVKTELDASLEELVEGTEAITSSDEVGETEPYAKAVEDLLAKAEDLKRKANERTGLEAQDRSSMSKHLDGARGALETLKEDNRDPTETSPTSQVDSAQAMLDLLRSVPQGLNQFERQRQGADHQLSQHRNRFLDEIQREVGRLEQYHRGLLSQKGISPDVKELADALDAMQQTGLDQKKAMQWGQAVLDDRFADVEAAAEGVEDHIQAIHDLGSFGETQHLPNMLANQQRQADQQRSEWERLMNRQRGETRKSDQAVATAMSKVRSQWSKTRDKLDSDQQPGHDEPVNQLLASADGHAKPEADGASELMPAEEFRAKAARMADAVAQTAGDDQTAQQQAASLRKELENLTRQIAKDEQTAQKHAGERDSQRSRIGKDWQTAQGQLRDKAARISDALKPADPNAPAAEARDPKLAKVKAGLDRLAAQTKRVKVPDGLQAETVVRELTERSKALGSLRQDATSLNQTQRQMQNGIARDEADKLDRNISNLAASLGRKSGDMKRQQTNLDQIVDAHQAALQQSLDRVKEARADVSNLKSTDAKAIADMLATVPENATELVGDISTRQAFLDQANQAQQRAAEWYAKATGQAGTSERLLADAHQQLRRVAEALAEAGFSKQNADAAADMLGETWSEIPTDDLSSLENAVAAAEALHGRIETDFHSLRAAEIAARSGQSFEQMRHEAGTHSDQREAIRVPDADTAIATVGDLRAYRQAMDTAVAQTEGLTQQARTMQRQALGLDDPNLVAALQEARAAALRQQAQGRAPVSIGRDPTGRRDPGAYSDTYHQMTFDGRPAREKPLDVKRIKAEALPGRRFTEESTRRGWLYIDTWYVIGPWENHGKIDYSNVHSPEFEVDLAKAYASGKASRKLRWQFTQHPTIRCDVPDEQTNSTYYAYTEVYFDQPREMLVAIATNDAGKLWIDDKLIWQDDGLSIWNMDEGFRRVRFKQGFSKVLMRIENGPRFCQYSLMLCPPNI